jgi:hypothetical protein
LLPFQCACLISFFSFFHLFAIIDFFHPCHFANITARLSARAVVRVHMKKTPAMVGTAGVLIRTTTPGARELGAGETSGVCEFDPSTSLNLYKIAHSEKTMYKSNNSASAVTSKQRGDEHRSWPRALSV